MQDVTDTPDSDLREGVHADSSLMYVDTFHPGKFVGDLERDSNPLLEEMLVKLPQSLWTDQSKPEYSSALGVVDDREHLGLRSALEIVSHVRGTSGKGYSKLPYMAHDDGTEVDQSLLTELCSQQAFVDQLPANSKNLKSIPMVPSSSFLGGVKASNLDSQCSPLCSE